MWEFRFDVRGMAYIFWAGLKGAVPIVLATFPATLGLGAAQDVFNVVFFRVVVAVLVQGLIAARDGETARRHRAAALARLLRGGRVG